MVKYDLEAIKIYKQVKTSIIKYQGAKMLINDFKDTEKIQLDSVGELDVIFEYHKSFVIHEYHQRLNGLKYG